MKAFTSDSLVTISPTLLSFIYKELEDKNQPIEFDHDDDKEMERIHALSKVKSEFLNITSEINYGDIRITSRFDECVRRGWYRATYINHYLCTNNSDEELYSCILKTVLNGAVLKHALDNKGKVSIRFFDEDNLYFKITYNGVTYRITLLDVKEILRFFLTKARIIHDLELAKRFEATYDYKGQVKYFKRLFKVEKLRAKK